MAIQKLFISGPQPASTTTGRTTNVVEDWTCILDGKSTPAGVLALLRNGVPQYNFPSIAEGTQNADDETVKAVNLSVTRMETDRDQKIFKATVTYTNNSTTLNNSNNPLEAQPQISADFVDRLVLVEQDTVNDEVIQNAAGTPIVVEENIPLQKVSITRNEEDYDLLQANAHIGRLNETSVTILGKTFDEFTCLLQRWSGVNQYDAEGNLYWQVTYEILIDIDTFKKIFVQRGVVDVNRNPYGGVSGVSSSIEKKLNTDGTFKTPEEQEDITDIDTTDPFTTIRVSNWGRAVRLEAFPADTINELSGGS